LGEANAARYKLTDALCSPWGDKFAHPWSLW